jgi:predicted RNase H-like nuclease
MFVTGTDGCRGGWVSFKVDLTSLNISVELVDLPPMLRNKPDDLAILAVDIPIGLLDGSRLCDKTARKLLGQPRGTSVFAAPCGHPSAQRITPLPVRRTSGSREEV